MSSPIHTERGILHARRCPKKNRSQRERSKQTVRRRQARDEPAIDYLANETQRLTTDTDTSNGRYRKRALDTAPTLGMTRDHTPRRALSFRRSLLN